MAAPRVLVIDDDPTFRNIVATVLRKNYLVSVAGSGVEGLEKAQEFTPDVVILDVQMPGLDGVQTLGAIRAHPALARIPVMMLTGDSTKTTVLGALQAGANDYLLKMTMRKEELLAKVERLLSQRQAPPAGPTGGPVGGKVAGRPSPPAAAPARFAPAATVPAATVPAATVPAATVPRPAAAAPLATPATPRVSPSPATAALAGDRSPGRSCPLVAPQVSAGPLPETSAADKPSPPAVATFAVATPPPRTADLQTVLDGWE